MSKFKKLSDVKSCETYVIAGQQGRGKTYTIMQELKDLSDESNVLWLSTGNNRGLDSLGIDIFYSSVLSWPVFDEAIKEIVSNNLIYDVIIIDTLDEIVQLYLQFIRNTSKPVGSLTQQDYLIAAENITRDVKRLLERTKKLYCTVNIVRKKDGALSIAVNRDLYNKVLSVFTNRWVCKTKVIKGVVNYDILKELHNFSEYSPR